MERCGKNFVLWPIAGVLSVEHLEKIDREVEKLKKIRSKWSPTRDEGEECPMI